MKTEFNHPALCKSCNWHGIKGNLLIGWDENENDLVVCPNCESPYVEVNPEESVPQQVKPPLMHTKWAKTFLIVAGMLLGVFILFRLFGAPLQSI